MLTQYLRSQIRSNNSLVDRSHVCKVLNICFISLLIIRTNCNDIFHNVGMLFSDFLQDLDLTCWQ